MKILAINPVFSSTEVAFFENGTRSWSETLSHDLCDLEKFTSIIAQEDFRFGLIRQLLERRETDLKTVAAFVATGGLLHPVEGGTYAVNVKMLQDLISCKYGESAVNLGAPLAARLANAAGCKYVYIVDPPIVDEMSEVAHMTGLPEIRRKSVFHALNQKAVAHREAEKRGKTAQECNFVVCDMSDTISIGAHKGGRVVEVNDVYGGLGPMSLERCGTLPSIALIDLCFSGKYSKDELKTRVLGVGGFVAHLGTNDWNEITKRFRSGDRRTRMVMEAFVHQLAMDIGACAAVLRGQVDAIILTGAMACDESLCENIRSLVEWIAPVVVYPGEDEMQALSDGVMRVMRGQEETKVYA